MKRFIILALTLSSIFICKVEAARPLQKSTAFKKALTTNQCSAGDSRCSYEKRDKHNGTTMHFDAYGKLVGRTKP